MWDFVGNSRHAISCYCCCCDWANTKRFYTWLITTAAISLQFPLPSYEKKGVVTPYSNDTQTASSVHWIRCKNFMLRVTRSHRLIPTPNAIIHRRVLPLKTGFIVSMIWNWNWKGDEISSRSVQARIVIDIENRVIIGIPADGRDWLRNCCIGWGFAPYILWSEGMNRN